MEYGFGAPVSGPLSGPKDLARIAVEGEAIGYDYCTLSDHVVIPRELGFRAEGGGELCRPLRRGSQHMRVDQTGDDGAAGQIDSARGRARGPAPRVSNLRHGRRS